MENCSFSGTRNERQIMKTSKQSIGMQTGVNESADSGQKRSARMQACRNWLANSFLVWAAWYVLAARATPGPDSHETGQGPHGHLFGEWDGVRTRLEKRGVKFNLQYVSDSLWNLKSVQPERFASWNRFRAEVRVAPTHNFYVK